MSADPFDLQIELLPSIGEVAQSDWNSLNQNDYPFTKYQFLSALETSGCVGKDTGWHPRHIVIYQNSKLVAAMPCYRKDHSYGEYVFDWSWAQAYQQNGLDYYPKLVSAIPFTPVPGSRLLCKKTADEALLMRALLAAVQSRAKSAEYSGWHLLFPEAEFLKSCTELPLLKREDVQFHWHNHNYQSFDDFLKTLRSSKRKQLRRERRIVADQGIEMRRYSGNQIGTKILESFYICYCQTYLRRSGHSGYLNQRFFEKILESIGDQIMIVLALEDEQPVAASLFLFDSAKLYGRYWGCTTNVDCLHFEACYYQGIEFAIERGLTEFNPGTQGEHKLARGFEPTKTYSLHWLEDQRFQSAPEEFMQRESDYKTEYQMAAREALPFREDNSPGKTK